MEKNNQNKRFVKVKCHKCENKQTIFGRSTTIVKCIKCGETLCFPKGGKASIQAEIIEMV